MPLQEHTVSEDQLITMLSLQNSLNTRVNQDWLSAGNAWYRAIIVEGSEAIEHHGWKWWKAQKKDLLQLQIELVDIWHFALSQVLENANGDIKSAAEHLLSEQNEGDLIAFDGRSIELSPLNILEMLELLIGLAASSRFSLALFNALLAACELDWDTLYRQYVSKNVLNLFRQDFGYREGSYIKIWNGREDNEHLAEILEQLDFNLTDIQKVIYSALEERYRQAA